MPHCRKCHDSHPRPVGRKCTQPSPSPASPGPSTPEHTDLGTHSALPGIQEALLGIMDRLEALELNSHPTEPTAAHAFPPAQFASPRPLTEPAATAAPGASIADRVSRHMREYGLSEDEDEEHVTTAKPLWSRQKSGRSRTTTDTVLRQIPWPHFGVFKGPYRKPATYDSLIIAEFLAGYARIVSRADGPTAKAMLGHLSDLMDDASTYSFENVRNFHGILLGLMEQDDITWSDTEAIQKLRQQYARISNPTTRSPTPLAGKPCSEFQQGQCSLPDGCAWCFKVRGKGCRHSEKDCLSKLQRTAAKNE